MRLIDADALLKQIDLLPFGAMEFSELARVNHIVRIIQCQQTLDYAPVVHGQWLWEGRYKACSECGSYINSETLGYSFWRYCPYCGARMDGGESDA